MSDADKIRRWCQDYSSTDENLFVTRLRGGGLTDRQILVVIMAMINICNHCWDHDGICHCTNDE